MMSRPHAELAAPTARIAALPMRQSRKKGTQLLVISSDRRGWTVPKGEAVGDEPLQRALSRLVYEQAGAIGTVRGDPIGSFLDMSCSGEGKLTPQRLKLYAFDVRGTLVSWRDRGIRTRRWISASEIVNWISEPGLSLLIQNWVAVPQTEEQLRYAETAG